jgi:hypothetical protein
MQDKKAFYCTAGQKGLFIVLRDKKAFSLSCRTKRPFHYTAGQKGLFIVLRDKKAFLLYCRTNLYYGKIWPKFYPVGQKVRDETSVDEKT